MKINVRKSLLFWKKEWVGYMLYEKWAYIGLPSLEFELIIKKRVNFIGKEDKVN